jgi:putative NIF3 family GTP cyclohydrolase 1 type 2
MIVKDIIKLLDDKYPFCYAEDYDNVGLIIGDEQNKVKGIHSLPRCNRKRN